MNLRHFIHWGVLCSAAALLLDACSDQDFDNVNKQAEEVQVDHLSSEMEKVRDYVPKFAVIAHRGSIFWTPEETEAAYRWAREMGADYLECDLQCSKDGVILALHDDNLTRTTNIQDLYGEDVPRTRKQFYIDHMGMTEAEAEKQYQEDRANFKFGYASSYMYDELAKLDAGTWFNINADNIKQARKGFTRIHQYISTLEDLVNYAKGNRLDRELVDGKPEGERKYNIENLGNGKVKYHFSYIADDKYDDGTPTSGNHPGIYIEFKESWLNPSTFEKDVYDKLDELNYNIITKPSTDNAFYKDGKVNVGNTNGKVILQTFSLESLRRSSTVFDGKIPMCFLLWKGTGATDMKEDTPVGYASFINLGIKYKACIMGPAIAGAPNNYPEMDAPWEAYLIKKSGMLNHPYSFDSSDQMKKYFGEYNFGAEDASLFQPPYLDGAFTNRSDITIPYFIMKGKRPAPAPQTVPDPRELLNKLGYEK